MTPDIPFERIETNNQQDAIYNRINAIKRIEYLSGVNLANESSEFKKLVDIEMYTRFYKDQDQNHQIDEEFCQNCAIVVKELVSLDPEKLATIKLGADERVKELYYSVKKTPVIDEPLGAILDKPNIIKRILNWILNV